MQCATRVARTARKAWVLLLALGLLLVPATAATADASSDAMLEPESGWHGRAIQEPHTHLLVLLGHP